MAAKRVCPAAEGGGMRFAFPPYACYLTVWSVISAKNVCDSLFRITVAHFAGFVTSTLGASDGPP